MYMYVQIYACAVHTVLHSLNDNTMSIPYCWQSLKIFMSTKFCLGSLLSNDISSPKLASLSLSCWGVSVTAELTLPDAKTQLNKQLISFCIYKHVCQWFCIRATKRFITCTCTMYTSIHLSTCTTCMYINKYIQYMYNANVHNLHVHVNLLPACKSVFFLSWISTLPDKLWSILDLDLTNLEKNVNDSESWLYAWCLEMYNDRLVIIMYTCMVMHGEWWSTRDDAWDV